MSNQKKIKQLKITLLTLSLVTAGFMTVANAGNTPFSQNDAQTTKLTIKGDTKKCGEGKCGGDMKKADVEKSKDGVDKTADVLEDSAQEAVQTPDVDASEPEQVEAQKKCGS